MVTDREFDMLRAQVSVLTTAAEQSAVLSERISTLTREFEKRSNWIRTLGIVVLVQVLATVGQFVIIWYGRGK